MKRQTYILLFSFLLQVIKFYGAEYKALPTGSCLPMDLPGGSQISVNSSAGLICPGDTVILTASGGLTYLWTPPVQYLDSAGEQVTVAPTLTTTYTVTGLLTNGGIDTASITIYVYPLATITLNPQNDTICSGDSIQLSASGTQTFAWEPGNSLSDSTISNPVASPATTTVYTILGIDINGCITKDSLVLGIMPLPNITIYSSDTMLCQGDTAVLAASGGIFYTWTPLSSLPPYPNLTYKVAPYYNTTYTVTGFGPGGCSAKNSILIRVNQPPSKPVITLNMDHIFVTDSGYANYSWYYGSQLISTASGPTYKPNHGNGSYYVVVTDSNSCTAVSNIWTITGINVNLGAEKIYIVPNPTATLATISLNLLEAKVIRLEMLDMLGRIVNEMELGNKAPGTYRFQMNIGHLPAGMYVMRVSIGEKIVTKKVQVQ